MVQPLTNQFTGQLQIVKLGNLIRIPGATALPAALMDELQAALSFEHKKLHYGKDAYDDTTGHRRRMTVTPRMLFRVAQGALWTNLGLVDRVVRICKKHGVVIHYSDESPPPARPKAYLGQPENVASFFQYRERQEVCLEAMEQHKRGIIHASTGFGKMVIVNMACLRWPHARFDIVTDRVPLVEQLVDYLSRTIPTIGQIGGGRRKPGERVTVYTADSLHHSDFLADFLLVDEVHECVTETISPLIARYQRSRNFGLTASPVGRRDGADIRLESLFGKTIFYLPYPEAQALGLVAPIHVRWNDVHLSRNPAQGYEEIERKRHGIWLNEGRNDRIAEVVRTQIPDDEQYLILTSTLYHAAELKRRLPNAILFYNSIDPKRFANYKADGTLPADEPIMTRDLKRARQKMLEHGEGSFIATGVGAVGIDTKHLVHLVMANPVTSEISLVQAPGRASRINPAIDKTCGYVHDFADQFDEGWYRDARFRRRFYDTMGWTQENVHA